MKTLNVHGPLVNLYPLLRDGEVVAFDAGPDQTVYVAAALAPVQHRETAPNGVSFAVTRPATPQTYRVLDVDAAGAVRETIIRDEPFNIHHVQPVGESLLLACARSRYRGPDDIEENGRLYDRDGRFLRGLVLGDGIQSVQATAAGVIWTSYFDEGIFGNFGWEDPIGSCGLIAWDTAGHRLFEYEPPADLGEMADCYALNVATESEVWCDNYTDFPLVQIRDGAVAASWPCDVRGSGAFAVRPPYVLFRGGYEQSDAYVLCRIPDERGGTAEVVESFTLRDAFPGRFTPDRISARGSRIYFLSSWQVYFVDVDDAVRALQDGS